MTEPVDRVLAVAAANERLRQERETFDQLKAQDRQSFALRRTMGWVAVGMLPAIGFASGYIVLQRAAFPEYLVTVAAGTLFVDTAGLVIGIWRAFAGSRPQPLQPVTGRELEPPLP